MATINYAGGLYTLNNGVIEVNVQDTSMSKPTALDSMYVVKPDLSLQKVSGSSTDYFQIKLESGGAFADFYPQTTHKTSIIWNITYGLDGTDAYVRAEMTNTYYVSLHDMYLNTMVLTWTLKDGESFIRKHYDLGFSKATRTQITNYLYVTYSSSPTIPMQFTAHRKLSIDRCETDTWVESAGITSAVDLVTFKEGTASVKLSATTSTNGQEVYKALSNVNMNDSNMIFLYLRPGDTTDLEDAVKFFIEDSVGGKQYFPRTYNLKQYYKLNDLKTSHAKISEWLGIPLDISTFTRGSVTKFGVQSQTNTAWECFIDDAWYWGFETVDVSPSTNFDFKINVTSPADPVSQEVSYLPYLIVSDEISSVTYGTSVITSWPWTKLTSIQGDVDSRATLAPRQECRDLSEDGKTLQSDTYYVGTRGATFPTVLSNVDSIHEGINGLVITTPSNPKPVYDETGGMQIRPSDYYDFKEFLTKLMTTTDSGIAGLSKGVNTYIFHLGTAAGIHYRDPDKWWEWQNVIQDNKIDMMRLSIDRWKLSNPSKNRRLWVEATNEISEGRRAVEAFPNSHVAVRYTGADHYGRNWVYTANNGTDRFISLGRTEEDFTASYYDDIIQDGVTFELDYTYPRMNGAFWSCYTTAAYWGESVPTLFDVLRDKIEYTAKYFDVDAITFSEVTIHYRNTFHPRDLILYNAWRVTQGLSTLSDFDRADNGQPVSDGNRYVIDDINLWNWRTYQVKQACAVYHNICKQYGKKFVIDVNPDNNSDVYNKNAAPWVGKEFGGDTPKYNGYYGARHATGMDEMVKVCDLLYVWHYFGYADPSYGIQSLYDFCEFMRPYKGRAMIALGTFPSNDPPSASDTRLALDYLTENGWKQIVVGKNMIFSPYWPEVRGAWADLPWIESETSNNTITVTINR